MGLAIRAASLVIGLAVLVGATPARALEVGDDAPPVMLQGVGQDSKDVLNNIAEVLNPEQQSYTIVEFFNTADADSNTNLSPLSEMAVDMTEFVATRLVATDLEVADVRTFIKNNQSDIKFPVHFDNQGDAQRAYGVTKVPTIFVIKDEKKVIFKYQGALTDAAVEQIRKAVGY